jgi:dienelactone hydrolase
MMESISFAQRPLRILCALCVEMFLLFISPAWAQPAYTGGGAVIRSETDGAPQDLPATLLKPNGAGPFPAIVILHDCSGLGPRSSGAPGRWGALLAAEGYVVLIPDSFLPRGFPEGVCTVPPSAQTTKTLPRVRAGDAYAALAFLRAQPYVDKNHIGVMGGSHGGSSTLATLVKPGEPALAAQRAGGYAAGIALYPGCGANYGQWRVTRTDGQRGPVTQFLGTYEPLAPLLILVGAEDDWTPAEHCRVLAERAAAAGFPVSIKIYPGAYHSFDSNGPRRYIEARNNANKPDGHGATTGGDPEAWADAIVQVKTFFAAKLKPQK